MNFNRSSFLTKSTYICQLLPSQKTMFSRILIAIDGSDASMDAADYAISISEQYNAELLYALHVIHPADADLFGSTGEMTTAAYYTIDMNKEAQKYLIKLNSKQMKRIFR